MKKENISLQLAEQEYFTGATLTISEIKMLAEAGLLGKVEQKVESFKDHTEAVKDDFAPTPKTSLRRGKSLYLNTDKDALKDLMYDVERKFELTVFNADPQKYSKVDINALKKFIVLYTRRNIKDEFTRHELAKILDNTSVINLYRDLCWLAEC